jgi:plastocyanin domain-containing protein
MRQESKEESMSSKLTKVLMAAGMFLAGLGASSARAEGNVQEVEITVDRGYQPSRIDLKEGKPARLVFTRREHTPCTKEVVFEAFGIRRALPPNQRVVIDLPALEEGEYEFTCGMKMQRGSIIVARERQP